MLNSITKDLLTIKPIMKKVSTYIFLFFPIFCFSQIKIDGKVKGEAETVPFVNVIFIDQSNNTIKGAVTNDGGLFELFLGKGIYKLKVSHIGYENYEKIITIDHDLTIEDIILMKKKNELAEITVVSDKKRIIQKMDRLIFNVEDSPIASAGTASDALKASPGLVNRNDEWSMIGKSGVKVMINDRMINLSGQDLIIFLNSIPASNIKEIEIITNPPAKYEAEGNSGIVNIKLKKAKINSWNNAFSSSYVQAKYTKFTLNNSFAYQKNKLTLLLNLSGTKGLVFAESIGNMYFKAGLNKYIFLYKDNADAYSGRFSLDYELSKKSKIGIQYLGSKSIPNSILNSNTTIINPSDAIDTLLISKSDFRKQINNHSVNAHYEYKIDTLGKGLLVDLDFLDYYAIRNNSVNTKKELSTGKFIGLDFSDDSYATSKIKNFNIKFDLLWPTKFADLSGGGKIGSIDSKAGIESFNTITGYPVKNYLRSNQFQYIEYIQALYLNGVKKINANLEVQLGLRAERTETRGIIESTNQINKNKYTKLYPTFFMSYKKNNTNVFNLNYGRRIERPKYSQLNPSQFYFNSKTYSVGNIFLKPTYEDNVEFTHIFKDNLTSKLSFSARSNASTMVYYGSDSTNTQKISFANFYTRFSYGLTESYLVKIAPWWKSQNSISLFYSESTLTDKSINVAMKNGYEVYGSSNNYITFSKSITGEIDFWYDSPFNDVIYHYAGAYNLDLACTFKSIIKNFTFTAGVYDVLNSSPRVISSFVNNINQDFISYPSNRVFRINVVYSFGNKNISTRERKSGNEEEKRRS
jgi:iron complex outermembrane receptor protein